MEKTLHILLIEDDMNTCNRISNYIATKDNMDLAGVTNNSASWWWERTVFPL